MPDFALRVDRLYADHLKDLSSHLLERPFVPDDFPDYYGNSNASKSTLTQDSSYPVWASAMANLAYNLISSGEKSSVIFEHIAAERRALAYFNNPDISDEGLALEGFRIEDQNPFGMLRVDTNVIAGLRITPDQISSGSLSAWWGKALDRYHQAPANSDGSKMIMFSDAELGCITLGTICLNGSQELVFQFGPLSRTNYDWVFNSSDRLISDKNVLPLDEKVHSFSHILYGATNMHLARRGIDACNRSFFSGLATYCFDHKVLIKQDVDKRMLFDPSQDQSISDFSNMLFENIRG